MVEIGPIDGHERKIAPTDVAQFIRLEQCQRYLRLRLYQRNGGSSFMREYGVKPQSIPRLLTRSGEDFEHKVESAVASHLWKVNQATDEAHGANRAHDHERILQLARDLKAEETVVVFQPRLSVRLAAWRIRGDMDILRMARDAAGQLHLLIADMKSSTSARVEHRLQVAIYHAMLSALLSEAGIAHEPIELGILYRGPAEEGDPEPAERQRLEREAAACQQYFGERVGFLEIVEDAESYLGAVAELVTDPGSTAEQVLGTPFEDLPFFLNYKCDGCMFNEFCMKWTAERDDLSLTPTITLEDKTGLRRNGVDTMRQLAAVKDLEGKELRTPPGGEDLVRRLSATWPVGPRLDELIVRARSYRKWKDKTTAALSYLPSKGYGSLPYSDAAQNPNLVRVYIDAQHDYLHDRVYMLGTLVVASEGGKEVRRRSVVHLADGPPDAPEREEKLFLAWVEETLRAVVELAAPDAAGEPCAPIHLIFWNRFEQRVLLEGLARHFERILGATPLYDFVTQIAGFDSAIATYLDEEIRELKNYPMVCQSLQAVAAYLRFDWNAGTPYREIFRTRMFDFWGKFDWEEPKEIPWYISRARFNSQIPLEYAYAAWNDLPAPPTKGPDDYASYRGATPQLLLGFHRRRLEAIEHVAHDFPGNRSTEKSPFRLPDLATFEGKASTMADALAEFLTIERHVDLAAWKAAHLPPPERRALSGTTLIARFCPEDQEPGVVERNRENLRRYELRDDYEQAAKAADPSATLTKEQRKETAWDQKGMRIRLRLDVSGLDYGLDEMLALSDCKEGARVVVMPRWMEDGRLPKAQRTRNITPTPKAMLYGPRADVVKTEVCRDDTGRALEAWIELEMASSSAKSPYPGFAFPSIDRPFKGGEHYTIDVDPNNWYGSFCMAPVREIIAGAGNTLYRRLLERDSWETDWPQEAAEAQARFLQGLRALREAGAFHDFELGKCDYIGRHGDSPVLLVQGPPGTGKSYSTAFAIFARLQGAVAVERDFRVFVTCKTHAATDVLLRNVARVQETLRELWAEHEDLLRPYLDPRILEVPLFRLMGREEDIPGVVYLKKKDDRAPGDPDPVKAISGERWCVVGAAPGGIYRLLKDGFKTLSGHELCDCLVLDEASQMNLPEAVMAALPLTPCGQLIVVGDHRQMPPIVKHAWDGELRRTFREFRTYESLFSWLLSMGPPMIKFAESFRLHADMAEFLRREIYVRDGIAFHSKQRRELPPVALDDPFAASVLRPEHPIVVVVHDEAASLVANAFERELIAPVLEALAKRFEYGAAHGLGVVVPHRAQRAALQERLPMLTVLDPATGAPVRSAVDTVERFQGDEREAILVSATESDPQYLLLSSEFLLDPRRLTVALSRAKRKMVLVASRSVFNLFSTDEETFSHAQLWKNLLRTTCTEKLWEGERCGHHVEVWGNSR